MQGLKTAAGRCPDQLGVAHEAESVREWCYKVPLEVQSFGAQGFHVGSREFRVQAIARTVSGDIGFPRSGGLSTVSMLALKGFGQLGYS